MEPKRPSATTAQSPVTFLDEATGRGSVIVDLRNIFDPVAMRAAGFSYGSIGRGLPPIETEEEKSAARRREFLEGALIRS